MRIVAIVLLLPIMLMLTSCGNSSDVEYIGVSEFRFNGLHLYLPKNGQGSSGAQPLRFDFKWNNKILYIYDREDGTYSIDTPTTNGFAAVKGQYVSFDDDGTPSITEKRGEDWLVDESLQKQAHEVFTKLTEKLNYVGIFKKMKSRKSSSESWFSRVVIWLISNHKGTRVALT